MLLLTGYSLLFMIIGLFSQEAIILMTSRDYILSWTAVPILVLGFSMKSIYYFFVSTLFYFKETSRKIFIATVIGGFSDIISAYYLIPVYGMYGAAIAFTVSKIIILMIVYIIGYKYNKSIGFKMKPMLSIVLTSLMFLGLGLYFSYTKYTLEFSWINILYKLFILLIYVGLIYFKNKETIDHVVKVLLEKINQTKEGR